MKATLDKKTYEIILNLLLGKLEEIRFDAKNKLDNDTYSMVLNLLEEKIEEIKYEPKNKNLWRYRLAAYKWREVGKKAKVSKNPK